MVLLLKGYDVRQVVVVVLTVAVLFAYGALLKWSFEHGHWWVLGVGLALTAWAGYALSSPAERREFAQEIRRITGIGHR
jgi:uncharacterized membrane protein YfcA